MLISSHFCNARNFTIEIIQSEVERGVNQSLADIASGEPKLFWQIRASWGELLTKLMAERFQVTVVYTSDITWAAKRSFEKGYNEAVVAHLAKEFGADAYPSVLREVDEFRRLRYKSYFDGK